MREASGWLILFFLLFFHFSCYLLSCRLCLDLPTNLGEGLVILVAVFFGATLPILPVQILWINMTTAGVLGLILAFEAREPGIMTRLPVIPKYQSFTNTLIARILLVETLLLIGAFGFSAYLSCSTWRNRIV
ncbi:MAG: cation transporting ATPase C-terminal domain-containing protein [Desulfobulbaceae bacterium]|nr:cation transporting ATPase C-terminal domain-containing protein [Desulfobulbaceae bacterium]